MYSSISEIETLVYAFEKHELPKEKWTHAAHLTVGLWYVSNFSIDEAMDKVRVNIRSYNESVGGQNTSTSGYHETISRFYILILNDYAKNTSSSLSVELFNNMLESELSAPSYPFHFYSKDYLMSENARAIFCEPDLKPLFEKEIV